MEEITECSAKIDIPALHLVRGEPLRGFHSTCQTLSEALQLYLRLKGVGRDKTFHRGAERNIKSVIELLGDRPLGEYSSSDAATYRDYLLKRGLTTNSSGLSRRCCGASTVFSSDSNGC